MGSTPTIAEANALVKRYLHDAQAQLPPHAEYHKSYQETEGTCGDASQDQKMVLATLTYRITGLDPDKYPQYFTKLGQWWENHGYTILKREPDYMWIQHDADEFRLYLKSNDAGELYLGATSPCVWPNGTPAPEG